jgi:hypothetical protein
VSVVVAPISETTSAVFVSGISCQFLEKNANNRCSILFHFLVPCG